MPRFLLVDWNTGIRGVVAIGLAWAIYLTATHFAERSKYRRLARLFLRCPGEWGWAELSQIVGGWGLYEALDRLHKEGAIERVMETPIPFDRPRRTLYRGVREP